MNPEKKKQTLSDIMTLIVMLGVLVAIVRLWPILLLLLIGVISYALWALVHVWKQPVQAEPASPPNPSAPATEQSVLNEAFGLLQRRINEAVAGRYPDARWVWSVSDAFGQFTSGRPLAILLNGAGGYQKATVQVKELQFVGLTYGDSPDTEPRQDSQPEQPEEDSQEEPEPIDFGLIAFEWVEANLQKLNAQGNEIVAEGKKEFHIPAEELPHGDGWPAVCAELTRCGFSAAIPVAGGIQVKIKTEGA